MVLQHDCCTPMLSVPEYRLFEVEVVRYNYRLRPDVQARRALEAEWHRCRFLWNEAVHQGMSGNKPTVCNAARVILVAAERGHPRVDDVSHLLLLLGVGLSGAVRS